MKKSTNRLLKTVTRLVLLVLLLNMTITVVNSLTLDNSVDATETKSLSTPSLETAGPKPVKEKPVTVILNDTPILFADISYAPLFDIEKSRACIDEISVDIQTIEAALNSNEYTLEAINRMQQELNRLRSIVVSFNADIDTYSAWEQEYFYAAKTWQFFRQRGYSEVVTSAIIGNMMIETSGGTLALKPEVYSPGKSFYGLCQWSLYYKPFMAGKSFEEQLAYLNDDMSAEFGTFGFCYKSGFTYEDFLAMDNCREAAKAFAMVYERCGRGSYSMRADCAEITYEYFVLGK